MSKEEYQAAGQRLAYMRKQAGVSQDELADRLEKPQSFVSACERGQRRIDLLELVRIARALKRDPREMFAALVEPSSRV